MSNDLDSGHAAPQVSLSNRRETPPFFGVDRISVAFLAAWFQPDALGWDTVTTRLPGTPSQATTRSASVPLNDHCKAFVGVQEIPQTGQTWAKVELNPSRVGDPEGHSLATPDQAASALEDAIDAASSLLVPACPSVGEMKLRRLDVARDFTDVDRPDLLLPGLAPLPRPWARRNLVHFDPARGGAQTLMVGSGAGVVRLYDKDAETGGAAPGVLRWEAECRKDWCDKYGGMSTVNDLDQQNVSNLGQNRWDWSAMGREVESTEAIIEKVMRSGLSFTEQRNLIGYLTMTVYGADVVAGNSTHSKYRRAARELGLALSPGSMLDVDAPAFSMRLDLESGKALCRVG